MLPEEISENRTKRYNGTVHYLKKIHSDLMVLRIKPDFPCPSYLPGQYCSLGLGGWEPRFPGTQDELLKPEDEAKLIRRAYSISSSLLDETGALIDPAKTGYIEFYIVLVRENPPDVKPPGLTPRLFMLQVGDRINIGEKITGHYNLEGVNPDHNVVFLSTGTGEAPNNAMVAELLRKGHRGKIISACCVRMRNDLGYYATHMELMKRYLNYQYLALTTREADTKTHKIYIQDLIQGGELEKKLGEPLNPANTQVFLCGNPKMIGVPSKDKQTGIRTYPIPLGVIEILESRGFTTDNATTKTKGQVHFEEYW